MMALLSHVSAYPYDRKMGAGDTAVETLVQWDKNELRFFQVSCLQPTPRLNQFNPTNPPPRTTPTWNGVG